MADRAGKLKDIESLRAVLRSYKQDPENIPFSEWKSIVNDFCELVDKDIIPFESSLGAFCHHLVSWHSEEVEDICAECELSKSAKRDDISQWRDTLEKLMSGDYTIEAMREILKPLVETDDCDYKEEKRTTSFSSFNLGMLYGIALARILYTEETGDVKS